MTSWIRDRAAGTRAMLEVFGDASLLRAALRFEAELARAQADVGLLSPASAEAIAQACAVAPDVGAIAEAAAHAGTLAIPLVEAIRARVAAAEPEVAKLVHRGATSQDVADTAMVLQLVQAAELVRHEGARTVRALDALVEAHAATPMLGRTLLQGALPITFGLAVAGWRQDIDGALARFERELAAACRLQLGGAAGALHGLEGRGLAIAARLAARLSLAASILPWHAARGDLAGLGAALAILTGALGKIATDVALLTQTEVAEAAEPRVPGRGGSSAMAHKHNPVGCQVAVSAAIRAPHLAASLVSGMLHQQHARGLGGWQAEGPVMAELFVLAHGALSALAPVLEGLVVDTGRMAENLAAARVGDDTGEAAALVARASAQRGAGGERGERDEPGERGGER